MMFNFTTKTNHFQKMKLFRLKERLGHRQINHKNSGLIAHSHEQSTRVGDEKN